MSTTVRIRAEDKARLDRLQARYLLKNGERIALDAMLHRMLRVAERHEDEVLASDAPPKVSPAARKRILALPSDFGAETSPDSIDRELYGTDEA